MPNITPKSPEVLQAQAAAFAAECAGYGDGQDLVREIGNTTVGMEVSFDTPPSQRQWVVSSREKEYVEFLRENGGQASPLIQDRARMLERYEDFTPEVKAVLTDLEGVNSIEWPEHPNYMGRRRTCSAFEIMHQGESYALRVPMEVGFGVDREYVRPALKTAGKNHMEQMVAVSYDEGITISEIVPGSSMDKITSEQMAEIPDEHLEELAGTIGVMQESGLLTDFNPSNVMYDPEEGFGFIDLGDTKYGSAATRGGNDIASMLCAGGDLLLDPMHMSAEEIEMSEQGPRVVEKKIELCDVFIPIISKYRSICARQFADHKSIDMIDHRLGIKLTGLIDYKKSLTNSSQQDRITLSDD